MSSLIFLGINIVTFIIIYGIMFLLVPVILGPFFSIDLSDQMDEEWIAINDETEEVIQFLIPLVPTIGIFILILKVLMVSSVRGRD